VVTGFGHPTQAQRRRAPFRLRFQHGTPVPGAPAHTPTCPNPAGAERRQAAGAERDLPVLTGRPAEATEAVPVNRTRPRVTGESGGADRVRPSGRHPADQRRARRPHRAAVQEASGGAPLLLFPAGDEAAATLWPRTTDGGPAADIAERRQRRTAARAGLFRRGGLEPVP